MVGGNNATVTFYTVTEGAWGAEPVVEVVAVIEGRLSTLNDTERIAAQTLERNSTHRFFTKHMGVVDAERAVILAGNYAGDYRVRTSERMQGGGINYQRFDFEYFGLADDVPELPT